MKKVLILLLTLVMTVTAAGFVFAAPAGSDKQPPDNEAGELLVTSLYTGIGNWETPAEDGGKILSDSALVCINNDTFFIVAEVNGKLDPVVRGTVSGGSSKDTVFSFEQEYSAGKGLTDLKSAKDYTLAEILDMGFTLTVKPEKGKNIVSVFYGKEKQSYKNESGKTKMLTTFWVYYADGTFEQFAYIGKEPELFSTGIYKITPENGFFAASEGEKDVMLSIGRDRKYKAGKGLAAYESYHTYNLSELGFEPVFCKPVLPSHASKDRTILVIFAGADKQAVELPGQRAGEDNKTDTFWVYYSDNTFEQYAELNHDFILFSSGTYEFPDGGDFGSGEGTPLVIRRNKKYITGAGLSDYHSVNTVELGELGFTRIYYAKDAGKEIESLFAGAFSQEYTDKEGVTSMLDSILIFYKDLTIDKLVYLDGRIEPYAAGTYSFGENSDFRFFKEEEEHGTITISYDKIMEAGGKLKGTELEKTYRLGRMGYTHIYEAY